MEDWLERTYRYFRLIPGTDLGTTVFSKLPYYHTVRYGTYGTVHTVRYIRYGTYGTLRNSSCNGNNTSIGTVFASQYLLLGFCCLFSQVLPNDVLDAQIQESVTLAAAV
jgi:hypothetical protein